MLRCLINKGFQMPRKQTRTFSSLKKKTVLIGLFVILGLALITSIMNLNSSNVSSLIEQENVHYQKKLIANAFADTDEETQQVLNIDLALAERSIGSDDAPLVIHEFSSLSCGHCAKFHNETLDQIKQEYVDTGKVKIVFHDFPLNRPALTATLLSRCLPKSQYYKFTQLLFKTQEQWAFVPQFQDLLVQRAKLAGLNQEKALLCLMSQDLMTQLIEKVKTTSQKYMIQSTPTFIFGDGDDKIEGALPYESFKEKIESHLKK